MTAFRTVCALFALVFAVSLVARAEEDKEVTLKGKITCAKCDLKLEKECMNVIQVKDGDKTVTYYFDPAKKEHKEVCTAAKEGTVVGTVSEKDGKKIVKVSKVEFAK